MNKKLLTLAVAAGLALPVAPAFADVKIFGKIQAETGDTDISGNAAANAYSGIGDSDTTKMGSGSSASGAIQGGGSNALGIKGSEKLGNGLTTYFVINQQFSTFDGGTAFGSRERLVGLKGDGWHMQFGAFDSRYKKASKKYDPFYGTGLQSRFYGAMSGAHNGYIEDAMEIGFKSGGWSGGFQITWEDSSNDNNAAALGNMDQVDSGTWSGNVKYKASNWEAGFAYLDLEYNYGAAGSGDAEAWKVHGKYSVNGFTFMANYEKIDADSTAAVNGVRRPDGSSSGIMSNFLTRRSNQVGAREYDSLHLSMTYKFSDSTTLMARYADTDLENLVDTNVDVDGKHWGVGIKHNLSKRTHVYGGYVDNSYDYNGGNGDLDVDTWAVGLLHKF